MTHRAETQCIVQQTVQREVLCNGFHLSGHNLGFDPLTQKLEPHFIVKQTVQKKVLLK